MGLKKKLYRGCKALGLFAVARRLTRHKLRILAYHGTELRDESGFSNELFIRGETLQARLELLRKGGYPVLPLGEAVGRLREGTLPACAVVVTIDDGFHSTFAKALPLFKQAGIPATIYVTSYYVGREAPVFRLALQYCFWKSEAKELALDRLGVGVAGLVDLEDPEAKHDIVWELINHGELRMDEDGRSRVLRALAAELRVDLDALIEGRMLHLMSVAELRKVAETLDVQLHTHRHRIPRDLLRARAEIEDNRRALQPVVGGGLVHFCYPSGFFSAGMFPVLKAAGIETATTCEVGLNDRSTHPYALRRFLDSERIDPIEFEAEVSGFAELLRGARRLFRKERPTVEATPLEREAGYPVAHGRTLQDRPRARFSA